jgi:hypothetical protein
MLAMLEYVMFEKVLHSTFYRLKLPKERRLGFPHPPNKFLILILSPHVSNAELQVTREFQVSLITVGLPA